MWIVTYGGWIALSVLTITVLTTLGLVVTAALRAARKRRLAEAEAERARVAKEEHETPWTIFSRPVLGSDDQPTRRWEVGVERVTPGGRPLNRVVIAKMHESDLTQREDSQGIAEGLQGDYNHARVGMGKAGRGPQ